MVNNDQDLDAIFRALADPTRRAMLASLQRGGRTVSDLAAPHAISLAGASKHIGVLERAGLLMRDRRGREVHCSINAQALRAAEAWLQTCAAAWEARLDRLDELLIAEKNNE